MDIPVADLGKMSIVVGAAASGWFVVLGQVLEQVLEVEMLGIGLDYVVQ